MYNREIIMKKRISTVGDTLRYPIVMDAFAIVAVRVSKLPIPKIPLIPTQITKKNNMERLK